MVFEREVYSLFGNQDEIVNDILTVVKSKELSLTTKNHTLSYLLCSYRIEDCLNNKECWSVNAAQFIKYNKYNFFFKVGLIPTFDKRKLQNELIKNAITLDFDSVKKLLDEKVEYVAIVHDEFAKVEGISDKEYFKNPRKALREAGIMLPVTTKELK